MSGHSLMDCSMHVDCSTPGFPVLHYLPEFAQMHVHWFSDAIQHVILLSPPSPPAINLTQHQGLFQWVSSSHQLAKVLELQFQHQSFQWIFRVDFLQDWDLLAVQGTLKSFLQHHSSKASVLQCSAFFMVQLSHLNIITGKTIAFTIQTFVCKVMSLLFNMLSRLVIAFLPRSKHLLISWLWFQCTVILEPKLIKMLLFPFSPPSTCHEVMGPNAMIFVFWMLNCKPAFSLSSFTLIKRIFSLSSFSVIRVVSSAYLRLLIFLWAILIPACDSSSLAFCITYSA